MSGMRNGRIEPVDGDTSGDASLAEPPPRRRRLSRPTAALLGASLCGIAAAQDAAVSDADQPQWNGALSQRTLEDGSVLNEYVTRTAANDGIDASFEIGFVPRFGCTPSIGVRVDESSADEIEARLADGEGIAFALDGEAVTVTLVADADDAATTFWLDETLADRERFRQRMDVSSRIELALAGGAALVFSLLGSQRSVAAMETACRTHEPLPYEG